MKANEVGKQVKEKGKRENNRKEEIQECDKYKDI
jgi:hypothetical protein